MPRRVPLSSRPLDFLYFAFILVRIQCSGRNPRGSQRIAEIDPYTLHGAN